MRKAFGWSLLAWLLIVAPSLAADPVASVKAPPRVPSGGVIFLDASESRSDLPLQWQIVSETPATLPLVAFDKDAKKGVYAAVFGPPDGAYVFALVAVGVTPSGKPDEPPAVRVAIKTVQVTVGPLSPLKPDPTPGPDPMPGPVPTDPLERKGYDYAKAVNDAITSALGAAALGRYDSTSELGAAQRKAFTDGLRAAFDPVAADLIKQVGELSSQPSARDVQATQDYLKKIQAGVKAAK